MVQEHAEVIFAIKASGTTVIDGDPRMNDVPDMSPDALKQLRTSVYLELKALDLRSIEITEKKDMLEAKRVRDQALALRALHAAVEYELIARTDPVVDVQAV